MTKQVWQSGGSMIIAPDGTVVGGRLTGEERILTAEPPTRAVIDTG
jgi:hypothetical protein